MEDKGLFQPRESWGMIAANAVIFVAMIAAAWLLVWAGGILLDELKHLIN